LILHRRTKVNPAEDERILVEGRVDRYKLEEDICPRKANALDNDSIGFEESPSLALNIQCFSFVIICRLD
jgi:hypothetical protein